MSRGARLAARSDVSTALALCSDGALRELVDAAAPVGSGIGGRSALLEIAGTRVFVKRVPLTDLERRPENTRSTADLFALPAFFHYGIGSPGFGAWRELAVHDMTTNWMLAGSHEGFPQMYHWRVLPGSQSALPDELADVERAVAYWGGGSQVRHRIEALGESSASIALFLEYIPQNLHEWLGVQVSAGDEAANRALIMVEKELEAGISFMNARGLLHFDAHFENILTDGQRLYFADYGLAVSSRFELSQDESGFFDRHLTYDRCYTATHLVRWLVTSLYGCQGEDRDALVRKYAQGERPEGIPEAAAAILTRHAPLAAVMSDFYRKLQRQSRDTPYPLEEIRKLDGMPGAYDYRKRVDEICSGMILSLDILSILGLSMHRFRTSVVCALGLALLGAGLAAGPAYAASASASAADTITISSAGSPAAHVGELSVVADSTTPITSLTVHVLSSGQDVLDPAMTVQSQTPTAGGYQSTWTVANPIAEGTSPTGLPLGVYALSVDATDGGTSVTGVGAGTLYFVDEPTLTIGPASPPAVSFDNPAVTISGQVTILAPDGTVSDYQGEIRLVSSWQPGTIPVTTDVNGDYQATVSPTATGTYVYAQLAAASGIVTSSVVLFNVQVDAVAIKASLSAATVTYHAKESVAGTMTYQPAPGAAYKPLPDYKVAVYSEQAPTIPAATGVTDANGNFKIALPTAQTTAWRVAAGGDSRFLSYASADLNMYVNLPTVVTGFHVSLNQHWQLTFGGCLGLTQPAPNADLYVSPGPVIQWADSPGGPWHTLERIETNVAACGHDGAAFSGTATAPVNYAYYRAYYPGSAAGYQSDGYTPTTSAKVLAWRYGDRITSFGVSARTVNAGHDLTVKGQLQYWYGGWHNYRNQQILIILRPEGSGTWYLFVKVRTNASGHFSATFADPTSATWSADYEGNPTHLSAGSAEIYVRLRGAASGTKAGLGQFSL